MSNSNKNPQNCALSLIDPLISERQLVRTEDLTLLDRRSFLVNSMIAGAGLSLSPLQLVIAQTQRRRGFWATFLGWAEIAGEILGFGPQIQIIRGVLGFLVNARQAYREKGMRAIQDVLGELSGYQYNPFKLPPRDLPPYSNIIITNATRTSSDRRFHFPVLRSDGLNGATIFSDWSDATESDVRSFRRGTTILAAPSTTALISDKVRDFLARYGYEGSVLRDDVFYPRLQLGQPTFGNYDGVYAGSDKYETRSGATVNISYKVTQNTPTGGRGKGEIELFKLEDKASSNKRMGIKRVSFTFDEQGPSGQDEQPTRLTPKFVPNLINYQLNEWRKGYSDLNR